MNDTVLHKLDAVLTRGYFRTIDLFAGCGGMSLGFDRAGFRSVASIEINDAARKSHEVNFGFKASEGYKAHADIRSTAPEEAVKHLCDLANGPQDAVDIVIGGPPCQAFSRLGRAAIWRLSGEDFAHGEDERANYYLEYLHYVAALNPIAFVLENVREMGKFVGRNVAEEIAATTDEMGYETRYTLLNAVWYGVPQLRERMFIIGIRKELGTTPEFPRICHQYKLPVGYSTSRSGSGHPEVLLPRDHYVDHADKKRKQLAAVTVKDAFADLPKIFHHLDGRPGKGFRRDIEKQHSYTGQGNEFTHEMRNWPDFIAGESFTGHVIRYTPRDYEIFRRMPAGGMYPDALEVAEVIFREKLAFEEKRIGSRIRKGSNLWNKIFKSTVPPYKNHRYPNKFRKMWADHPARTVPAHIGKDSYSHIHFDSEQARAISLREAARLQSFPDAFYLEGSMNTQLTQIGNAVPPLLAFEVAGQLRKKIFEANKKTTKIDRAPGTRKIAAAE